jgi:signal recognition particle GTPase
VQLKPDEWDVPSVIRRVATMVGMGNVDDLMKKEQDQQQQGMDPKVMADMAEIQFKMVELKQKTQDSQQQGMIDVLAEKMDVLKEYMKLANNREERASREKIEQNKLAVEQMNLAEGAMIHPLAAPIAQQFVRDWPQVIAPPRPQGRII